MQRMDIRRHIRHKVKGLFLLPFCLLTLLPFPIACTQIDCPVQNTVNTNYVLRKATGTADTLNTDTVWIWTRRADGTDTLLLNSLCGSAATGFTLPISHTQPEDVFVLLLADTTQTYYMDTIRIKKDDMPHFESVDCQASYFHRLTAVSTTHHILDSVTINNPDVNYDPTTEHLYVYIKADR